MELSRRQVIRTYRDLRVWQHAVELFVLVTRLVRQLPFAERLVFESQIRRAARGVSCSIAEGFRRWDLGDYVRSLSYAIGSLAEVETDLELIHRTNKVDEDQIHACVTLCETTHRELRRQTINLRRLRAKKLRERP